jgi:glucose/arabinose dehydrogenase
MVSDPSRTDRSFWVIEKDGKVQSFKKSGSHAQVHEVLDMGKVEGFTNVGEQGLLGMAVDPHFSRNSFVYFYQSSAKTTPAESEENTQASLIVRYSWDVKKAAFDPTSRKVLLSIPQESFSNHKAGMMAFSANGKLFVGTGDGGSAGDPHNNAQNKNSLLGKILRFNIQNGELGLPRDNPFAGDSSARPEIWAYGLRNPWRFSFDRKTGQLWVGDVGQDRWEEIDLVTAGGNYGWKLWEGNVEFENRDHRKPRDYRAPLHVYRQSPHASVVGGYVYHGHQQPALEGAYLFGDYVSGKIWMLKSGRSQPTVRDMGVVKGLVSFAEDHSGEIYAISVEGQIFELR